MIEHVQPWTGYGSRVNRPKENILGLLRKCDNQIKHYHHAILSNFFGGQSTKFSFSFKKDLDNAYTPPRIMFCYGALRKEEKFVRISFQQRVSRVLNVHLESDDFLVRLDDGSEVSVLHGLKNMHSATRAVVETLEFALVDKNSFLGHPLRKAAKP